MNHTLNLVDKAFAVLLTQKLGRIDQKLHAVNVR